MSWALVLVSRFSFLVFLPIINSYGMKKFPFSEFFNISDETKSAAFSKYLCTMKKDEGKCCQCEDTYNMGDICIDYWWDASSHNDLNKYLNASYFLSKEEHVYFGAACQPILNHIPATSEHLVEHLQVISHEAYDSSNITDCVDYERMNSRKEFNIMALTEYSGFYYNKDCIGLLGVTTPVKIHVPIKVYCVKTYNLTLDMVFRVESLNLLEKCIFVVDTFNDKHLEKRVEMHRCAHYGRSCERNSPYHDLCNMYTAPIRGYRNIHCALCGNQTWSHYEKVEQCTDCPNGLCDLHQRVDRFIYPISFSLIPDENGTEHRVKNVTHFISFPLEDFFGIRSNDTRLFKPFLCNQTNDSCCNCEKDCMKYHTCCADILWKYEHPVEIKEYKQLLIDTASIHKRHDCVPLVPVVKENSKRYQMITKCSPRKRLPLNEEDENRCLDLDGFETSKSTKYIIPVIGTDGYLYRNMYCARCNGIETYKPIILTCFSPFYDDFDIKYCKFEIDAKKNVKDREIVKECNESMIECDTKNVNSDLCHAYKGNIGPYRNYHCYLCQDSKNNVPEIKKCSPRNDTRGKQHSITFEMNTLRATSILPKKKHICETDNIFELFGSRCRIKKMELLSDNEFDRCMERSNISMFAKETKVNAEIKSNSTWKMSLQSRFAYEIIQYINNSYEKIYQIRSKDTIAIKDVISQYLDNLKSLLESKDVKQFYLSQTDEPFISNDYNLDIGNTFPKERLCNNDKKYMKLLDRKNVSFTDSCQIKYEGTLYDIADVSIWIVFNRFTVLRFIAVCELFYMDPKQNKCPLKTIKTDNLAIGTDGTISFKENEIFVAKKVAEYRPLMFGEGVVVCAPNNLSSWINSIHKYSIIASLTGRSLNLIFYFNIIYAIFSIESLGKHLPLTISLILLDVSVLVSTALNEFLSVEEFAFCNIIAAVNHFAFVMVQIWCFICCFDVRYNVTNSFAQPTRFMFNVRVSLLLTILNVFTGYLMDYLGYVPLGYNNNNNTCISFTFIGYLCFFITPMAVSIGLSIWFSRRVIVNISTKNKDENPNDNVKESFQLLYLTLKNVMVVEVVEILSFIRQYDTYKSTVNLTFSILGLFNVLINGTRGAILFYVYYNSKQKINKTKNIPQLDSIIS